MGIEEERKTRRTLDLIDGCRMCADNIPVSYTTLPGGGSGSGGSGGGGSGGGC